MVDECRLCRNQANLQRSHIIPRFAVQWVKDTSLTGYLRNLTSPKRQQETRRPYLLCAACEERLSLDERQFAQRIFIPYHSEGRTEFRYEEWMRRFLIGLLWRILAVRTASYPCNVGYVYSAASETWRRFLLSETQDPGEYELHVFFGDVVLDSTFALPPKANWYFARAFDAAPGFSRAGEALVYAKLAKIMVVAFLTPRDPQRENWQGTQVLSIGTLRTPQTMITKGFGAFLQDRMRLLERIPGKMTPRQFDKLVASVEADPSRLLSSESHRVFLADQEVRGRLQTRFRQLPMRGSDRNRPCPCGSGRKYKRCCGGG
jgi:hypothetical protein